MTTLINWDVKYSIMNGLNWQQSINGPFWCPNYLVQLNNF